MKKIGNILRAGATFVKRLHREAALDSLRNVLAIVGGATILADFGTMKAWLLLPMTLLAFVLWFLDYERHFRGQTVEEVKTEL